MSPPAEQQTPDLLSYSRRLGGMVTVVAALTVTAIASPVLRSTVIQTYVAAEVQKIEYLRELYPLPRDHLSPGTQIEPLESALSLWRVRAGWSGALYVGRMDVGPRWIPAGASLVPARYLTDLSWYAGPELIEPDIPSTRAGAARLLACRIDLDPDLSRPEYLLIFRPSDDLDRRLRSLYLLIFVVISGTLGMLFIALLRVVAHGEGLRRAALSRAEALRHKHDEAQAMLVQAAKMTALGELAAGIGHEVNNPVAMVSNAVEILSEHPATRDPEVRQGLTDIGEAAERIRKIVRNLSSFSAPQVMEMGPVELAPLLTRTLELAQLSISPRDTVRLDADLPGNLPPVRAQDGPIQQVFLNLLNNARYAVTRGGNRAAGELPSVMLTARLVDEPPVPFVRVQVKDNGPGVAPQHLPRLFEPFFTTKPRWEGTGLGLWVSHRIVESHGGRIRVESPPGGGTTFTVELPVAAPLPSDPRGRKAVSDA